MASNMRVEVKGLKELSDTLATMRTEIQGKLIRSATTAGARLIVLAARNNPDTPVDTGALKKSIKSLRDKRESKPGYEVRAVSVFKVYGVYGNTKHNVRKGRVGKKYLMDPPTFYWKFHELGTVKHRARHFVENALSQNIPAVIEAMRKRLAEGIVKIKGTKP